VKGYVVAFVAFYERGFYAPSDQLLCSMLQYYGLELHNLTPSGILHIATFMTLCEAYMGIAPHFDLWNYFFHVRCPQNPDAELTILGAWFFMSKSGHGVDPYFNIPIPRSMKGWQKMWFYLRNDADVPLPAFTNHHPIPLPTWGYMVARKVLDKLHPMHEVLQQL
jgi:hypothetical protein